MMSIGALVEDFRATLNTESSVAETANLLMRYFQDIYNYDIASLHWNPTPQGGLALGFQVAGYNVNSTVGEVHLCQVPPGNLSLLRDTNNAGCAWNGQIDVVSRLVLGFDPALSMSIRPTHIRTNPLPNQPTVADQLRGLQYIINWPTMTLQDAVDFASLMVNSTI